MNRRGFLKRGLLGGVLLASAGGFGLALWPTRKTYLPRTPLRVLDERQFAVMAAVAARTVGAPGADPIAIAHNADIALSMSSLEAQEDVKKLLLLFDNALAGLLFDLRPRPFTQLSPDEQDVALRKWQRSRIAIRRSGYVALRKLTQAAYYSQRSCWPEVGYPGPPVIGQNP